MTRKMPESVKSDLRLRRSKKGQREGYDYSIQCKAKFAHEQCFSNQSIKPPVHWKPHICMRLGWWRVSPMPPNLYDMPNKWRSAHNFVCAKNEPIRQQLFGRMRRDDADFRGS